MKWRTVALTDICRPRQWKTIPTSVLAESGYPVFGANGIIGFYSEYNHENPTVVITCRGATCGTVGITLPKSYITGNAMALDDLDEDQVDQKFLYYQLSRRGFRDVISGTAQPQITGQGLSIIKVNLPPLPEQKRIAAILDKADAIRRKREKAIELTDSFLQSVFLEMFGDPVKNSKNWRKVPLGEVSSARLGKMLDAKQQTGLHPRPYLRNTNVKWGYFQLDDIYQMDFDEKDRGEFRLVNGDVLICEGGEVGRAAVWRDEHQEMYFQKALHRVRPNQDFLLPDFLAALLKHLADRGGLVGHTSSATIAHLTGIKLKQLPIILPPVELQQRYVNVFTSATEMSRKAERGLSLIGKLGISISEQLLSKNSGARQRDRSFQEVAHAL